METRTVADRIWVAYATSHIIITAFVWISNLCFLCPSNYIVNKQGCMHQMSVAV